MAINIHARLPTPETSVANWLVPKIVQHRAPKQGALQNIATARIDVLTLAVLTGLGDVLIHAATAGAKLSLGVAHIILYPVWSGAAPRLYVTDAGLHASRSLKSLGAAFVVPIPALVNPDFAVASYRWLGLAPQSTTILKRLGDIFTQAWNSPYRNQGLIVGALTVAGAVGLVYIATASPEVVPVPIPKAVPPVPAAAPSPVRSADIPALVFDRAPQSESQEVPSAVATIPAWTKPTNSSSELQTCPIGSKFGPPALYPSKGFMNNGTHSVPSDSNLSSRGYSVGLTDVLICSAIAATIYYFPKQGTAAKPDKRLSASPNAHSGRMGSLELTDLHNGKVRQSPDEPGTELEVMKPTAAAPSMSTAPVKVETVQPPVQRPALPQQPPSMRMPSWSSIAEISEFLSNPGDGTEESLGAPFVHTDSIRSVQLFE